MDIEKIIRQIPAWQDSKFLRYEPLDGGYSNKVYKVFVENKEYVVRINSRQNEFLGLKYGDEIEIITLAAKHDMAPMPLNCGNNSDFLVTDFIDGTVLSTNQILDTNIINKITALLKKVHALPYPGAQNSNPFSLTRGFLAGAEKLGMTYPDDLIKFLKEMDVIENERRNDPGYQKCLCHNDAFTHNMIQRQDGSIMLIDWEFSGLGDIWFDLATLSFSCGFSQSADETMLLAYFGTVDEKKIKTLHDLKFVCMIRQIGWAFLHTAINRTLSNKNIDHTEFAYSVLDRLKKGLVTLV